MISELSDHFADTFSTTSVCSFCGLWGDYPPCADWHHQRKEVLRALEMHPAIDAYVDIYYGKYLHGPRQTVSLHLMLSHKTRTATKLKHDRQFPSVGMHALSSIAAV